MKRNWRSVRFSSQFARCVSFTKSLSKRRCQASNRPMHPLDGADVTCADCVASDRSGASIDFKDVSRPCVLPLPLGSALSSEHVSPSSGRLPRQKYGMCLAWDCHTNEVPPTLSSSAPPVSRRALKLSQVRCVCHSARPRGSIGTSSYCVRQLIGEMENLVGWRFNTGVAEVWF